MTAVPETRTIVYRTKKNSFWFISKIDIILLINNINHNSIAESVWGYFYSMTFKKKRISRKLFGKKLTIF